MRTVLKPFYERNINLQNPFEKDSLQREFFADNLTQLFSNSDDGLVVTINSKWGDGKTTFIKLWEMKLKNKNEFIPIYYNAFKNDFSGDAFLSIASNIQEAIKYKLKAEGINFKQRKQLKYVQKTTKKLAFDLVKMGTGVAISYLTGGLISNINIGNWLVKGFKRLTFGSLEVNIDEQFKSYNESMDSLNEFQSSLKQLIQSKDIQRKIVIFIDELDRCRPNFAVEIIEKIKHLFEIENVYFVLSINKNQMVQTISSVYGVNPNEGFEYLQKFVHLETQLPSMGGIVEEEKYFAIKAFIQDLLEEFDFSPKIMSNQLIMDTLCDLSQPSILNLNPRSIERVITLISIALSSCDIQTANILAKNFIFLAALKIGNPEIYNHVRSGSLDQQYSNVFKWANAYYDDTEKNKRASNVIDIHNIKSAINILDIYEIPSNSDLENKGIKENV